MYQIFISTVYIVAFVVFAIMIFFLRVPSLEDLRRYKMMRIHLGTAFMLLALKETLQLMFPVLSGDAFISVWTLTIFNLILVFLSFASFAVMMGSEKSLIGRMTWYFISGFCAILILGWFGFTFDGLMDLAQTLSILAYFIIAILLFVRIIREFDIFAMNMRVHGVKKAEYNWISVTLWMVFAISFLEALSLFHNPLSMITKLLFVLVYGFLTMRVLSFAFVKAAAIGIEQKNIVTAPDNIAPGEATIRIETSNWIAPAAQVAVPQQNKPVIQTAPAKRSGYMKVESLLKKWVDAEGYVNPDLTLADVAVEVGTNSSYLSSYLNKELGTTFSIWLNSLRVNKSIDFLQNLELSIEECGVQSGFSNIYNYSRWFKQITGLSPRDWRKLNCGERHTDSHNGSVTVS